MLIMPEGLGTSTGIAFIAVGFEVSALRVRILLKAATAVGRERSVGRSQPSELRSAAVERLLLRLVAVDNLHTGRSRRVVVAAPQHLNVVETRARILGIEGHSQLYVAFPLFRRDKLFELFRARVVN